MKKGTKLYYSLEETYLMALRCAKNQKSAFDSLAECRNEEKFDPIAVMVDFIETDENDVLMFEAHDMEGKTLYTWTRKE